MNKKIFIIEDDANILYGLQAKFRIEGFSVEINNGIEEKELLLMKLKESKPDYVILDLILPANDGFEIAKLIRSDETTKAIPIMVFTNLSDADSRARGIDVGIDQFVSKNEINLDELVQKVKKIFINKEKISN